MRKKFLSLLLLSSAVCFNMSSCSSEDDNEEEKQEEQVLVSDTTGTAAQGVTVSGRMGKYTFVDLGLSSGTMWATYNVGTSKPVEYGKYYSWGETNTKSNYDWSTYKWCKGSENTLTKYCLESKLGTVDKISALESSDDAATANWGSGWRIPTSIELEALVSGCNWEWTTDFNGSGVAGRIGTSKTNGNTIFLPAAGYHYQTDGSMAGRSGMYWSSSILVGDSEFAYILDFYENTYIRVTDEYYRLCGFPVRAVLK